ncbi:hypothetical protein [Paludisphaera soli]|uniref:hypothetical protein n=1 Tax=Paludisphaera soli TaxID=2712865 RepID=UPI0013EB3165|nr:hypothetical protein [Paludisphaera soli]
MQVWTSARGLAALLVGISMTSLATADEARVEDKESENVTVTCPTSGLAILSGSSMTVNGTIQVAKGELAPDLVTIGFLDDEDALLGSHTLTLGQETDSGTYKKTKTSHLFWINIKAPTRVGECRLVVETQKFAPGSAVDRTILRERMKPLKLEIK